MTLVMMIQNTLRLSVQNLKPPINNRTPGFTSNGASITRSFFFLPVYTLQQVQC